MWQIYKRGSELYNKIDERRVRMTKEEQRKDSNLEAIKKLRLIDDDFMNVCFQDAPKAVELVLQVIMDKSDFKVEEVKTQYFIKNIYGRSVRLDVYTTDDLKKKYNIEVQKKRDGAIPKRARYNSSLIDNKELPLGTEWEHLPETHVIFITEKDVLGEGLPIYHVDRYIKETKQSFADESHIIYVNGEIKDDTPLGRLMHDFQCTDADEMYYKELADRVRYFKEDEKGVRIMCEIMDEIRAEGRAEGRKEMEDEMKMEFLHNVERLQTKMKLTIQDALELLGKTITEYEDAKRILSK